MRRKPILTLSLLAAALALPGSAAALGLGKLTVNSALGQPLSAQIELTSAAKEDLDSLAARIGSPTLYQQNNLTYQGVLSRARVSVEHANNGEPYLKITTQSAVNEPFLDLLVEINWASGRVVRDYTFLLDPPGSAMPMVAVEPTAPVRPGAAAPRAAPTAAARAAAACGTSGRQVYGQARRHAVEDRERIPAVERHARADAGRDVPVERERVRRQEHESAAHGRDHHDPERRRCGHRRPPPMRRRSSACRRRIGAPIATASLLRRLRRKVPVGAQRAERSAPSPKRRRRPRRPGATSSRSRAKRARARAAAQLRRKRLPATRRCRRPRRGSPSSKRR